VYRQDISMMRFSWVVMVLLVGFKCAFAQTFSSMSIQFVPDEEGLWVVQSLSLMPSMDAVFDFPVLKDERSGLVFFSGAKEDIATQGQVEVEMVGRGVKFKTTGENVVRVSIRGFVPYENLSGALTFAPTFDLHRLSISVKRERHFSIQIRPLLPYTWEKDEEDTIIETMTALAPIKGGQKVEVSILHTPRLAKTMKLSGLVVVFLSFMVGALWVRHAR
jgi:hypothetical protein